VVVAGASEGIGRAFAESLAARGLNLVPVTRRAAQPQALADGLQARQRVVSLPLALDLAEPASHAALVAATERLDTSEAARERRLRGAPGHAGAGALTGCRSADRP
jgi:short-subunit dehydrogenase